MKSKVFLSVLMAVILLVTAGCGAGKEETPSGQSSVEGSESSNQDTDQEEKKVFKIGITQIAEHPSLDAARIGFIAALKDNGFIEGDNLEIDIQFAQGDMPTNTSIAQKFAGDKKDLVLAIATASAQAAAQEMKDTPILFTAITDPLGAKLVESLDKPGGNVTGTSDTHPEAITKLMDFIAAEFPKTKTVGMVSNEGEQNSLVNVENAEEALIKLGIKVVRASVANGSEVKQATESLVGRVDVIYIPKDNTVVAALESVIQVAESNKIPLFVGEKDSVERGGFASFGFDYYDLGYTTGKMAVDILKNGKKPADIPVGFPEQLDLALNLSAAAKQGIEVTPSMKNKVQDQENNIFE